MITLLVIGLLCVGVGAILRNTSFLPAAVYTGASGVARFLLSGSSLIAKVAVVTAPLGLLIWLYYTGNMPEFNWSWFQKVLWAEPTPRILLQILLVALVILWLAPPAKDKDGKVYRVFRLILTIAAGIFVFYVSNTVISGIQNWESPKFSRTSTQPTVYSSGQEVRLPWDNTKNNPLIFQFHGRITLHNSKPCTTPWIEWNEPMTKVKIIKSNTNFHHTYLETPPNSVAEVRVWLIPWSPCPRQY